RIVRLKKAVLYLIVGIGLLGGFRSLAQERPDITPAVAVNDYSFLEDYIKNYYKYPKDEESQQFLQEFTTGGSWNVSYDQKIKSAEVGTVEVYQVEPSDTEEGRLTSYASVSLDLKDDEGKRKRQTTYIAIRSIQKDGHYIVDRPISMISTAPAAMKEDMKKGLETEKEDIKGTDCTEQEKQEITNTIQLFFTTYAADLEQARLLMQDPETLKPLDPDTKPVFVSLQSAIQNEDEIQADVIVRYETKELFQQERSVRFLFDRKTNKIISKEEY
ncbi:conjugal transfer protein, partial [[Clostridium] innocuum]|nr:conjugal transfer protein [[Clostridium] innocuum]